MITAFILVTIAGIFNAQMDAIKHHPKQIWFPNWDWWIRNNWYYENKLVYLLMKYILYMFKDGWHLCKFIMTLALMFAIALQFEWWYAIVFYCWFGIIFNIFFEL